MTSTQWINLSYYGLKLKRDFTHLDSLIRKEKQKENPGDLEIDTILKMMKHKTTIAITIHRMIHEHETLNQIADIRKIITAVSPEALQEAYTKIDT